MARGLRADRGILVAKVDRQAAAIADLKKQIGGLEHQRKRWLGEQLNADASTNPEIHAELRITNERLIAENSSSVEQVTELRRINNVLEADLAASRQAHAEDIANLLADTGTSVTTPRAAEMTALRRRLHRSSDTPPRATDLSARTASV